MITWALGMAGVDVKAGAAKGSVPEVAPPPCPVTALASSTTLSSAHEGLGSVSVDGSSLKHSQPDEATETSNAAIVDGVWQSDSSQHAAVGPVNAGDSTRPTVCVPAQNGQPTLKVA